MCGPPYQLALLGRQRRRQERLVYGVGAAERVVKAIDLLEALVALLVDALALRHLVEDGRLRLRVVLDKLHVLQDWADDTVALVKYISHRDWAKIGTSEALLRCSLDELPKLMESFDKCYLRWRAFRNRFSSIPFFTQFQIFDLQNVLFKYSSCEETPCQLPFFGPKCP